MTMPGVQKPHWLPFPRATRSCAACGRAAVPTPSTVTTCLPSTLASGARHALTLAWYTRPVIGFTWLTTTVHAPHPPPLQPSLVPVRSMPRKYSSSVASGLTSRTTRVPLK